VVFIGNTGGDLVAIKYIDSLKVRSDLKSCNFYIACDVNNLLYCPLGASKIYGPQKGASEETVEQLFAIL